MPDRRRRPVPRSVYAVAVVLLALVVGSCAKGRASSAVDSRAALAAELDRLGLWRGLSDADRQVNIAAVAAGTHPWATSMSSDVSFPADGEALAEGGVEQFVASLAPALRVLGVKVSATTLSSGDNGTYVVAIDGIVVRLYDASSWESKVESELPWYASTMKPLAVVNGLLTAAGAKERCFVLYPGGNEGVVLLIDPRIVAAVQAAGLAEGNELPVEAVEASAGT